MQYEFIIPNIKNLLIQKGFIKKREGTYVLHHPKFLSKAMAYSKVEVLYRPGEDNQKVLKGKTEVERKEKEKEELLKIFNYLFQNGKTVGYVDFNHYISDDDLFYFAEHNYNFEICFRHMISSYESGLNVQLYYDVKEYQSIIKKVKYFASMAQQFCQADDEKVIFCIEQTSRYIKYPKVKGVYSEGVSDLYAALGRGEAVCIGYSMALWKVLQELGIPCNIVLGKGKESEEGHAWNQVCINGIWYNVDITSFSSLRQSSVILRSDEHFQSSYHPYQDTILYPCMEDYPRDRLESLLAYYRTLPNYLEEYDKQMGTSEIQKR